MKGDVRGLSWNEYTGIHMWLHRHFGKAVFCENKENCKKVSSYFEWALRPGFAYERKRENFFRLCKSCHVFLDSTPEGRERSRRARLGIPLRKETIDKIKINKRRKSDVYSFNGLTFTRPEWCEKLGIEPHTFGMRIKHGWSIARVLSTPTRSYNKV